MDGISKVRQPTKVILPKVAMQQLPPFVDNITRVWHEIMASILNSSYHRDRIVDTNKILQIVKEVAGPRVSPPKPSHTTPIGNQCKK